MVIPSLHALAVSAESLVAQHVGPRAVPALQKGLAELAAEPFIGATNNAPTRAQPSSSLVQHEQPRQVAGAALLAGGQFFDPALLHRQILELELKAEYTAEAEEDMDLALVQHTEGVIASSIEAAVRDALADSERASLGAALDSWSKEKRKIAEKFSLQVLDWSDVKEQGDQEMAVDDHRQVQRVRVDAATMELGEVTQRLNAYARLDDAQRREVDDSCNFAVISAFAEVKQGMVAHEAAFWGIAAAMCRERASLGNLLGREEHDACSAPEAARSVAAKAAKGEQWAKAWLARGGRRFVEEQHRAFVERELEANRDLLRAHVMGVDAFDRGGEAARYVALLWYRNELPAESSGKRANAMLEGPSLTTEVAPWAELYIALRSSGPRGALGAARSKSAVIYGGAILTALEAHAQHDAELELQGWLREDRQPLASRDALAASVAQVAAMYVELRAANEAARARRDVDAFVCPFRLATLNLLGFVDVDAAEGVTATIEDYMWQQLWFVTNDGDQLATLRTNLVRWGSAHFDPDNATPFLYANQLLLAGDLTKALTHLSDEGLAREALHLAISLDAYGLLRVTDNTCEKSSPRKKRTVVVEETWDLGAALWRYARRLALSGGNCALALEYIAWMRRRDAFQGVQESALDDVQRALPRLDPAASSDDEPTLTSSVVKLIVETREFSLLCGEAQVDGTRGRGLLDDHFTDAHRGDARETEALIAAAAKAANAKGHARDAVELFSLTGRNKSDCLRVYTDHLARHVVTGKRQQDTSLRREWLDSARAFAEKQHTPDTAEEQVTLAPLKREFRMLIFLAEFFDLVAQRQPPQALHLVDQLSILPADPREVQPKLADFALLPASVQRLFGDLALKYVDCLYVLHEKARDDANDTAAFNFRSRASTMVNFAGLLFSEQRGLLAVDVRAQLSRYEAMMM